MFDKRVVLSNFNLTVYKLQLPTLLRDDHVHCHHSLESCQQHVVGLLDDATGEVE